MEWPETPTIAECSWNDSIYWAADIRQKNCMGVPGEFPEYHGAHESITIPADLPTFRDPPTFTTLRSCSNPQLLLKDEASLGGATYETAADGMSHQNGNGLAANITSQMLECIKEEPADITTKKGDISDILYCRKTEKQVGTYRRKSSDGNAQPRNNHGKNEAVGSSSTVTNKIEGSYASVTSLSTCNEQPVCEGYGFSQCAQDTNRASTFPHLLSPLSNHQCFPLSPCAMPESMASLQFFGFPKFHNESDVYAPVGCVSSTDDVAHHGQATVGQPNSTTGNSNLSFHSANVSDCVKQPNSALYQDSHIAVPMPDADVQTFIFAQTKTRRHRNTSIRIYKYNDGDHFPYSHHQKASENAFLSGPSAPGSATTSFVHNISGDPGQQVLSSCSGYPNGSEMYHCRTTTMSYPNDLPTALENTAHPMVSRGGEIVNSASAADITSHSYQVEEKRNKDAYAARVQEQCGIPPTRPPRCTTTKTEPPEFQTAVAGRNDACFSGENGFPVPQNSPFFVGQGSIFCGQMPGGAGVPFHQGDPGSMMHAGTWRGNFPDHGFTYRSCGVIDVQQTWAGVGTCNQEFYATSWHTGAHGYGNAYDEMVSQHKRVAHPNGDPKTPHLLQRANERKMPSRQKPRNQKNRRFVCTHPNCTKRYFKQAHLEMHLRKHAGERPYKCTVEGCGRGFQRSDQLKRHGRRHTGERPYQCTICGRAFARSDHLKTHKKTHVDKPYICRWDNCKKKFAHPEELCRHFVTHNASKPKEC